MATDKNKFKIEDQVDPNTTLTTSDLKYILDVNKKAIEIYIEVDKQNEKILDNFEHFKSVAKMMTDELALIKRSEFNIEDLLVSDNNDAHNEIMESLTNVKSSMDAVKVFNDKMKEMVENIEGKIEDIEKSLFRLVLILGSTGIGLVITIVSAYFKK